MATDDSACLDEIEKLLDSTYGVLSPEEKMKKKEAILHSLLAPRDEAMDTGESKKTGDDTGEKELKSHPSKGATSNRVEERKSPIDAARGVKGRGRGRGTAWNGNRPMPNEMKKKEKKRDNNQKSQLVSTVEEKVTTDTTGSCEDTVTDTVTGEEGSGRGGRARNRGGRGRGRGRGGSIGGALGLLSSAVNGRKVIINNLNVNIGNRHNSREQRNRYFAQKRKEKKD